jgi:hypothetical protein
LGLDFDDVSYDVIPEDAYNVIIPPSDESGQGEYDEEE